jgi:hypothetical protein
MRFNMAKIKIELITFNTMCVDPNGDTENDFLISVTCEPNKKASFEDAWYKSRKKVVKKDDYSVRDIYEIMAKKGYAIVGLYHEGHVEG